MSYDEDPAGEDQPYDIQDSDEIDNGIERGLVELTVDVNNDDRADLSVGVATEDLDGDEIADAALVRTDDATLVFYDADGDTEVDVVVKVSDAGEQTGWQRGPDGEWVEGELDDGEGQTTAPEESVEPTEPAPEILIDGNGDNQADVSAGPATLDADGDGRLDTAIVTTDDGEAFAAYDADGDGLAEQVAEFDPTTGAILSAQVQDASGAWTELAAEETVFVTEAAPANTDQPTSDPVPDGQAPMIMIDADGDQQGDIEAGRATVDVDQDGTLDAAVTVEGDATYLSYDSDGDGLADEVGKFDTATGELLDLREQNDAGQWVAAPGVESDQPDAAPVEVPAEFRTDPPPTDSPAYFTWQAGENIKTTAAELWSMAHPGVPWPADDAGQAYHPYVVLGILANDESVDSQISDVARNGQDSWDKVADIAINGPRD